MHPMNRCVLLSLPLCTAFVPAQDWVLRTNPTSPAASTFPRMAYDVARARTVMFGGWNAPLGTIVFRDTWEWDGNNWQNRMPAVSPPERDDHAMSYDLARGVTVLFGGEDFNFNQLTETWEWNGTSWQNRQPATAPPGRLGGPMCYDLARGVTVLFGGVSGPTDLADTWEWNGTNWRQVSTIHAPSPRSHHAMAFDATRGRAVLFGGDHGGVLQADTWEYDGTDWTQVATDGEPPARADHGMAYDVARARIVLFGGADALIDRNDTWEYDGRRWAEVTTGTVPQGNSALACAYDIARSRTVVFGGFGGTAALGDTWEYGGTAPLYRTFGRGCNGSNNLEPLLAPRTLPALGQTLTIDLTQLPAGNVAGFLVTAQSSTLWGGQPLPRDLGFLGLTGCRGYTSADVAVLFTGSGGSASIGIAVPNQPGLAGLVVFQQALVADLAVLRPLPAAVSNAGEATLR